jgi:hypothetical protein
MTLKTPEMTGTKSKFRSKFRFRLYSVPATGRNFSGILNLENFNKPFGGIAVIMPPIGRSCLPHFSMTLLEREHTKKHHIYFTKCSKREHAEINSTLCCVGARLFESARLLHLSVQHRRENDPNHMTATLQK